MSDFINKNRHALSILLAIIGFAVITMVYFSPVLQGKRIKQHDIDMYKGMSKEISDFREETGEQTLWTNSMFGGMPSWNISVTQNSNLMTYINKILSVGFPHPVGAVFISMLGFFVLLMVLNAGTWVSFIGAVAYGLSSYLFIVLGAGHNSKAMAMAYMAPVIAGILLSYKGKYLWGTVLTALSLALEVRAGHLQITYYLLLIVVFVVLFEFVKAFKDKKFDVFFKASALLAVAAVLAVMTSSTNLYANYKYVNDTMRGKPVLSKDIDNQTNGLDRDYVTQWSYGIGETWSLMIPNVKGGASGYIGNDNPALHNVDSRFKQAIAQQNAYWGDQPGTSGPVYVGAIVVFLFVLGLFVVKNEYKWILLAATVLSILLSWGKNFMGFTDFFLDYVPGYNKFRAVSMTLVIAEVCMPLLAFLALAEIMKNPDVLKNNMKALYISFGLTGGICLIMSVMPDVFFNFLSKNEMAQFEQLTKGAGGSVYQSMMSQLEEVRMAVFRKDALRSFFFITASAICILLFVKGKMKQKILLPVLAVLVLVDMLPVDKRYLNNDNFISKRQFDRPFTMTKADEFILNDNTLDFRVVDISKNVFNDASTSYYHKSVGGYHGAKQRRYQDIISHYLDSEINDLRKGFSNAKTEYDVVKLLDNTKVLNMLNTKYVIYHGDAQPLINRNAFGNAWLVDEVRWVDTPNEEIDAIADTDVKNIAIVNREFEKDLINFKGNDSHGVIEMKSYKPNELVYEFESSADELVVFSEIWTSDGWKMTVDGKEHKILRADYMMRAALIPAGNHEIVMRYEPGVWKVGNAISFVTSLIILLALVAAVAFAFKQKKTEE